jgi:hypothetical protein
MHRQIEPVAVAGRGLGEPLPAFDVAAGVAGQGEVDEHPHLERPRLFSPGRYGHRILDVQLTDD